MYGFKRFSLSFAICFTLAGLLLAQERPNVILIMTDDQGIGDLGIMGNPDIITPNIDAFGKESVHLTNFHVHPQCAPTRAAMMTGKYAMRVGVWSTIHQRSIVACRQVTMGEVFKMNGYHTAIYGKWHLGDNYPTRPQDQGFDEVIIHGGGTIGNVADYLGNDYFDDTYQHNGEWKKFDGYCTDIWFAEAMKWMKSKKGEPFFVYLPTNAPHAPFNIDQKYVDMYNGKNVPNAEFYGMITNIDENFGLLRDFLETEGLADNTILIFMTDNGTVAGQDAYNAGYRGGKNSGYDGGHRVPFFIHWPDGNLPHGAKVDNLAAGIDLIPGFIGLLDFTPPPGVEFDGIDISGLFKGENENWPDRKIFSQHQFRHTPVRNSNNAVMSEQWRLVNGNELYDILKDKGQTHDVAKQNPGIVKELSDWRDDLWDSFQPARDSIVPIWIGHDGENPAYITAHDWQPGPAVAWHSSARNNPSTNGYFSVYIASDGHYNFTLRKAPIEAEDQQARNIMSDVNEARLSIQDVDITVNVTGSVEEVNIEVDLKKGPATLQTWLRDDQGAFYLYITRLTPVSVKLGKNIYGLTMEEIKSRLKKSTGKEQLVILSARGRKEFDSNTSDISTLSSALKGTGMHFAQFKSGNIIDTFKLIRNSRGAL